MKEIRRAKSVSELEFVRRLCKLLLVLYGSDFASPAGVCLQHAQSGWQQTNSEKTLSHTLDRRLGNLVVCLFSRLKQASGKFHAIKRTQTHIALHFCVHQESPSEKPLLTKCNVSMPVSQSEKHLYGLCYSVGIWCVVSFGGLFCIAKPFKVLLRGERIFANY